MAEAMEIPLVMEETEKGIVEAFHTVGDILNDSLDNLTLAVKDGWGALQNTASESHIYAKERPDLPSVAQFGQWFQEIGSESDSIAQPIRSGFTDIVGMLTWVKDSIVDTKKSAGEITADAMKEALRDEAAGDKLASAKEKMHKWWFKILQNKWFSRTLKIFSGLASSMGNIFFNVLSILLFMAFFDPSGSLLSSLILLFANLLIYVIKIFATLLPKIIGVFVAVIPTLVDALAVVAVEVAKLMPIIIDTIVKMIPVIFEALKLVIPEIVSAIAIIINSILGALKDQFPALSGIIDLIQRAVSAFADWINPEVVDSLLKIAAVILGVIAVIVVVMKVVAVVVAVVTIGIKVIAAILGVFTVAITILTSPVVLVVLAIAAVTAALWYMYKNWDTVMEFINSTIDNFKNIVKDMLKNIWSRIVGYITPLLADLMDFFLDLWDGLKARIRKTMEEIGKFLHVMFIQPFFTLFNTIFSRLNAVFKMFIDSIGANSPFGRALTIIMNFLREIGQFANRMMAALDLESIYQRLRGVFERFIKWLTEDSYLGKIITRIFGSEDGGGPMSAADSISLIEEQGRSDQQRKVQELGTRIIRGGAGIEDYIQANSANLDALAKVMAEKDTLTDVDGVGGIDGNDLIAALRDGDEAVVKAFAELAKSAEGRGNEIFTTYKGKSATIRI